jgi:hypothetical protein
MRRLSDLAEAMHSSGVKEQAALAGATTATL